MVGFGDVVALAGRSRRMLVVDATDRASQMVLCSWISAGAPVEVAYHVSRLVLLEKAAWPRPKAPRRGR